VTEKNGSAIEYEASWLRDIQRFSSLLFSLIKRLLPVMGIGSGWKPVHTNLRRGVSWRVSELKGEISTFLHNGMIPSESVVK
jgi:hypothetical protein